MKLFNPEEQMMQMLEQIKQQTLLKRRLDFEVQKTTLI